MKKKKANVIELADKYHKNTKKLEKIENQKLIKMSRNLF